MILPILKYPNNDLHRKASHIETISPQIKELAANMVETMYARDGIGLAAPQVGASVRLIVLDISGPEKREDLRVLLNPELSLSGPEHAYEEGCLSVPDFRATVYRPSKATCKAIDLNGHPVEFIAEDLLAICLQHEYDHLEGKLFLDHISMLKRMMHHKKVMNQLKKK